MDDQQASSSSSLLNQSVYHGKNHVNFAATSSATGDISSSVGTHNGVYQTHPATFGDQGAQQQQAGNATPVQTKKEK
jgi:hypothetical protein